MNLQKPSLKLVLLALGFLTGAGVLCAFGYVVLPWVWFYKTLPPLNWDVVEAKGSDCQLFDHRPLSNGRGIVAVLREANCPGYMSQGTEYYVIFIHGVGKANTKDNLVFQYTPGFKGYTILPPPKLVWRNQDRLEVTSPGVIERIVVQRPRESDVSVRYSLGEVRPDATDGTIR